MMPARGSHLNPLALPPGTRVSDYELERVLGSGGFGITYGGKDVKLGLAVAVKEFLPVSLATRRGKTVVPQHDGVKEAFHAALQDFVREARILASLQHQNIVRVIRFLEANGTAYLVMELLEGVTMAKWLKPGRPPGEPQLLALLGPVLDGLEHLHGKGLLHRDIKPDNIFITRQGKPVLIDFGSARAGLHASVPGGSIVSVGYSPFELYGTKVPTGAWTDIYSLGATLYTALMGSPPPDAMAREMQDTHAPLSRTCAGRCSGEFLAAVDLALHTQPKMRPQSVAAWRKMLPLHQNRGHRAVAGGGWGASSKLLLVAVMSGLLALGLTAWVLFEPDFQVNKTEFELEPEPKLPLTVPADPKGVVLPRPVPLPIVPAAVPVPTVKPQPSVPPPVPAPRPTQATVSAPVTAFVDQDLESGNGSDLARKMAHFPPQGVLRDDSGGQPQSISLSDLRREWQDHMTRFPVRRFTPDGTSIAAYDAAKDEATVRQTYDYRHERPDGEPYQGRQVRLVTVVDASKSTRLISGWRILSFYHRYQARLSYDNHIATSSQVNLGTMHYPDGPKFAINQIVKQDRVDYYASPQKRHRDGGDEACAFFQESANRSLLDTARQTLEPDTADALGTIKTGTPLVEVLFSTGQCPEDNAPHLIVRILSP